jgi:hypothetical protein
LLSSDASSRWVRLTGPLWRPALLGTLGSVGMVLTGSVIGSIPQPDTYRWWLTTPDGGYGVAHVLFYTSFMFLVVGWLGVGVHALTRRLSAAWSWGILALWGTPLFLGTPLFSRDVYSYIAQGQLVRHGLNPYLIAPRALGPGPLLSSVASVWRDTTSPYGPLFVEVTHVANALSGGSLIAQVLVFRAVEFIGVAMMMVALPALARHFGVSEGLALWLGVLSPLALFSAISSAHNDTLMLGLAAIALLVTVRGQRRWGLVLFALAATLKLPALAGVVFITASALRSVGTRERIRLLAEAVLLPALVIVVVTELTDLGWTWLSPGALRIPTELRVLTSPTVSVGKLASLVLHAVGMNVSTVSVVTFTQHLGELLAVIIGLALVSRTRRGNVTRMLGIGLLIAVVASPTVWPWYYLWGLTVLAVTSAQRSIFFVLVAGLAMLLVGPGGTPMIGGNGVYVSGPAVLVALIWFFRCGRWRAVLEGSDRV